MSNFVLLVTAPNFRQFLTDAETHPFVHGRYFAKATVPSTMECMQRIAVMWAVLTVVLGFSVSATAQRSLPKTTTAPAPGQARPGRPASQQELDAYNQLHNEPNPQVKKDLIDKFAATFPEAGLLAYVYQDGVALGLQAHNIEMMAEYGSKSLELWPDNCTLLTELGSVFVQRDRVDQAEAEATHALEVLAAASAPAGTTGAQWAENKKMLLARNYTTLGFVHLRRALATSGAEAGTSEAENAITSFKKALEYRPVDDFTFYGLGFAYAIQNDYANAESNLAKAVAIKGVVIASARTYLEEIYRSRHNKSLNGLDQVVAKARAELGIAPDVPRQPGS
jgi:tetratricopeptide (TPR) repeat protein